jgi:PKD repeat protein
MIENRAPILDVVTNGSRGKPITTSIGEEITFNASETFDIDGDDITYNWDFGDGEIGMGEVITYSYNKQGSYWVTLTATDGILDSSLTIQIHVSVKKNVIPP